MLLQYYFSPSTTKFTSLFIIHKEYLNRQIIMIFVYQFNKILSGGGKNIHNKAFTNSFLCLSNAVQRSLDNLNTSGRIGSLMFILDGKFKLEGSKMN